MSSASHVLSIFQEVPEASLLSQPRPVVRSWEKGMGAASLWEHRPPTHATAASPPAWFWEL